jgi:ubiquinone/menaquinone biosynthesis C-methylase UbiE
MKEKAISFIRCPKTKQRFERIEIELSNGDEIIKGKIYNEQGDAYHIENGIPDLTTEDDLIGDAKFARDYYKKIAHTYDENVDITFELYHEDEYTNRNYMVDLLKLKHNNRVLEVSAGTGKDSELILKRLSEKGELICIDISPDMLNYAKNKLNQFPNYTEAISASACNLPFEDNSFDALYCFAGVGHFPSIEKGLKEMARVVKPGGKVVFAEKNVPLWLKETTYGRILINNNPMFAYDVPLKFIPVEARQVGIRWIIGNVHYVIYYVFGDAEPVGNFDLELPGERGGTFNTRYFGKLEGVSNETKQLALSAQKKLAISMYEWLNDIISRESIRIIENNE